MSVQQTFKLKTSQHNHSMSNFGLHFFFRPNELNFCMWSPIAQKITALYCFPWFELHFQVKTHAKNRRLRDALLISLFGKTKGFLCLSFNNRPPPSFFAYILTGKRSANQRKKIQGCDFLLNRRPHAKIKLIWTKKRKADQNSTLCCDVFNLYGPLVSVSTGFHCTVYLLRVTCWSFLSNINAPFYTLSIHVWYVPCERFWWK